jgi:hypothetical protein
MKDFVKPIHLERLIDVTCLMGNKELPLQVMMNVIRLLAEVGIAYIIFNY